MDAGRAVQGVTGTGRSGAGFQGALGEVNLGAALRALFRLVKFVREDFHRLVTLITFTIKGLQILEIFKSGAVLGRRHGFLLMAAGKFFFQSPFFQGQGCALNRALPKG